MARDWPELGKKSIAGFIGLHDDPTCDSFATLLLKNYQVVRRIRKRSDDNDEFAQDVLSEWFEQKGVAIPCTWENMLECMEKAGLTPRTVQNIRDNLLGI